MSLQSSQALIKLPLEKCIRELEADNAEGALGQCQAADDELDALLGTGNSTGSL